MQQEWLAGRQSLMGETPYSPSPKGDATRTGILRQALASPFGRRPRWLPNVLDQDASADNANALADNKNATLLRKTVLSLLA
ncbi:hypothetical protein [Nostoc sp.]|uniref:hypothetical protein n=1 Tax=Nostoc sp. TaxID=1180 RepID=UPI002FF80EBB